MALDGTIRRRDKRPLGSPDHVKQELGKVFPNLSFKLVAEEDEAGPDYLRPFLASLKLVSPRYPYWHADFEGDGFIVTFNIGSSPAVDRISITIYGRGSTNADPFFETLGQQNGWHVTYR